MPKRSERDIFDDGKIFDTNPFDDFDPESVYKEIQWGNSPNEILDIESPEPLVNLGYVAKIYYIFPNQTKCVEAFDEKSYFLAVGSTSNLVYFIPVDFNYNIPDFDPASIEWESGPDIRRTDYISDKGGEECYYFHKHERPYPQVWKHSCGVSILIPADFDGQRSYAVIKEGIVG